jgi:hypothetical protein
LANGIALLNTRSGHPDTLPGMRHRHLGRSAMVVPAISWGNWITRGDQIEADAATACVHVALDVDLSDDFVAAIEAALAPVTIDDPRLTITPPPRT